MAEPEKLTGYLSVFEYFFFPPEVNLPLFLLDEDRVCGILNLTEMQKHWKGFWVFSKLAFW